MISNLLLWDWKCHGQLSWTVLFISVLAACFFWQQKFPAWTMYTLSYQSRPQLDRRIFVVVNTRHMQKDQQVAARVVQEMWLSLGRSISRARWCEHNSIHKTHVPFGNQTWKLEIHSIYIISMCIYIYTLYMNGGFQYVFDHLTTWSIFQPRLMTTKGTCNAPQNLILRWWLREAGHSVDVIFSPSPRSPVAHLVYVCLGFYMEAS